MREREIDMSATVADKVSVAEAEFMADKALAASAKAEAMVAKAKAKAMAEDKAEDITVADKVTKAEDMSDGQRLAEALAMADVSTVLAMRPDLDKRLTEALDAEDDKVGCVGTVLADLRPIFAGGDEISRLAKAYADLDAEISAWRGSVISVLYLDIRTKARKGDLTQGFLADALGVTQPRISQMVLAEAKARKDISDPRVVAWLDAEREAKAKAKADAEAAKDKAEVNDADAEAEARTVKMPEPKALASAKVLADVVAEVLASLPTSVVADSPEDREALAEVRASVLAWLDKVAPEADAEALAA